MASGSTARPAEASRPLALELAGLTAAYDRVEVLRGVDLSVPTGSVVALLGPNGAGKTTTLRVASGRLPASGGHVRINGVDVVGRRPEVLAREGVCSVPEGRGVFPDLTVAENLRMWTFRRGIARVDVEERTYERFPRLHQRRRQLAGTLSGGEQQMLAMSRALSTAPTLLLLDEISMGLAPLVVAELYEVVGQIAATGVSILLVEQFAHAALGIADSAAVMSRGQVQMQGPPAEVEAVLADIYLQAARR